jgi:hypothetical protein
MTSTVKSARSERLANPEPIYGRAWKQFKQFPKILSQGSKHPPDGSGVAASAFISAAIGCFTMMVVHHLGDTSKAREALIWKLGAWIPGSNNPSKLWGNIGSYTGKETMLLVGWLLSWVILHQLWKHKQIKSNSIFFWMFALMIAATAMCWHPLFPYMPLT